MKYLFGINITNDNKNKCMDGRMFISQSIPLDLRNNFQKWNHINKIIKRDINSPVWAELVYIFSFFISGFLICIAMEPIVNLGFKVTYANFPLVYHLIIIMGLNGIIFYGVNKYIMYKIGKLKPDIFRIRELIEGVDKSIRIPDDATIIVVLKFYYKIKHGKMKMLKRGVRELEFKQMYAYVRKEKLYLTDSFDEWSIPVECFKSIKKLNKHLCSLCFKWYHDDFELILPHDEVEKISALVKFVTLKSNKTVNFI